MANVQTETPPLSTVFNIDSHNRQVLENHVAFSKAHTADEMHRLNTELEHLVRKIEEAAT